MKNLLLKIYSITGWIIMLLSSVIITPFFLLSWLLSFWWDRPRIVTHMMGTFWAWYYQSLVVFWKLDLKGREKIPWNRPLVMVANHRSLVDILALYKLRRPFKWVSKAENFKLPFVGMVLSLSHCIKVDRENKRSGQMFIVRAEEEMKKGSSVLIFPEGTRAKTSAMGRFREGAFLLAKRRGCGIIPIVHTGSEKTFQQGKNSWVLSGKTRIRIRVLDEIPAEKVQELPVADLMNYTREIMEEGIRKIDSGEL